MMALLLHITIPTRQDLQPYNTTLHLQEFVWQSRMLFRPVIYDATPDKLGPFSVKMGPDNTIKNLNKQNPKNQPLCKLNFLNIQAKGSKALQEADVRRDRECTYFSLGFSGIEHTRF